MQYYYFTFTYGNGDYYNGYGYANDATYSYNQTWTKVDENGQTGNYKITSVYSGSYPLTNIGKVYVFNYYDFETKTSIYPDTQYDPVTYSSLPDGTAGLGSEHGTILSDSVLGAFGKDAVTGKQLEADVDPTKAVQYYNFTFTYGNGDSYTGNGYAQIGTYTNNQTWTVVDENGLSGTYKINSTSLQTHTAAYQDAGKVYISNYYDAESGQSIYPDQTYDLTSFYTQPNGTTGLGNEHGTIQGNNTIGAFGRDAGTGKQLEADVLMRYDFTFTYANGDSYSGEAYLAPKLYTNGQAWTVIDENNQTGSYHITGISLSNNTTAGEVDISTYYDSETHQTVYTDNPLAGNTGLGNEKGTILGNTTVGAFGHDTVTGKHLEADINISQALQIYNFTFSYGNGDYYQGQGYANVGTYTTDQTWTVTDENGQSGSYLIGWTSTEALGVNHTAADKGKVVVWNYYDAETDQDITPDGYANGGNYNGVSGITGLGSEHDTILGNTTFGSFGHDVVSGKQLEADVDPNNNVQGYHFTFTYGNGDSYTGNGFANTGTYTQFQTWSLVDENGKTGKYSIDWVTEGDPETFYSPADKGKVYIENYYDAESNQWFVPDGSVNFGVSGTAGLGSEHDTILGNTSIGAFGHDPVTWKQLEADVDLTTAVERYDFTFTYANGDYYEGYAFATLGSHTLNQTSLVTDENGQAGTYKIVSVSLTSNPQSDKGKVFIQHYYDSETDQMLTPDNASNALGTTGLGRERGSLLGNATLGAFGFDSVSGKQLEADIDLNTTAQFFTFTFTYGNGDYYTGHGYSALGTYSQGMNWIVTDENGQDATYYIDSLSLQTRLATDKGKVYVDHYYDSERKLTITPDNAISPAGIANLGSEHGILQGNTTIGKFGFDAITAKQLEADLAFNHAPSGTNTTVTTASGSVYTFAAANFGFTDAGDTPSNSLLAVKITTLPTAGALKLNGVAVLAGAFISAADIAAGKLKFTPTTLPDGSNSASFTFQVQDNGGTANGGSNLDATANTLTAMSGKTLNGTPGNDTLTGSAANDVLNGLAGNDILNGGGGADTMAGGDGNDTYYVDNTGDVVTETNAVPASGGTDIVYSYLASYTLGANVENLYLRAPGAANGTGNALNNLIYAGAGNNVLDGAAGTDTVSYYYAAAAVTASLAVATAQATGGSGSDKLLNFENLTGSGYNDTLAGNAGANVLNGGVGADKMTGGDGSDIYYVDNVGDVVTETNAVLATGGTDTVYSYLASYTYTLGNNVENLRLLAAGAANGRGNGLANTIYAGAGDNALDGLAGTDTVSYLYATAAVTASLAVTTAQATGGSGSDTLLNFENLTGSSYNDILTGNASANILTGGLGQDTLSGGLGADTFKYSSEAESGITAALRDIIQSFSAAQGDKIDLSGIDADLSVAGNQVFGSLTQGGTFSGSFAAPGDLYFDQTNHILYGNNDADAAADFSIGLVGVASLAVGSLTM